MKLIAGLGNPGARYDGTRHNVGFELVDRLARRWNVDVGREKFHGWFGTGEIEGHKVALLKPTTFMNLSGQSVLAAGRFYKMDASDLLVISDDLALPVGRLRIRARGSSGGHNGLQDIADRLGTDAWSRLRIGIGEAPYDPAAYVLGRFDAQERSEMDKVMEIAAEAVGCWVRDGVDRAMTDYNGDRTIREGDKEP